jgi:hypothetical protein
MVDCLGGWLVRMVGLGIKVKRLTFARTVLVSRCLLVFPYT